MAGSVTEVVSTIGAAILSVRVVSTLILGVGQLYSLLILLQGFGKGPRV